MGKVRLAGRVPDDQYHGLMAMSQKLLDYPHEVVTAIVKLDVGEIRTIIRDEGDDRYEGDEYVPVVKVLAIEPILHEPEKQRLATMYREAYFARTGDGQTLDEAGGILEFPRSRDAQETGESGLPPAATRDDGEDTTEDDGGSDHDSTPVAPPTFASAADG